MIFPPGSLQGPKVETKKALLLLDLQNDFVTSAGRLPVANTSPFLPKLPPLVAKFREKGQIIHVRTLFQRPCPAFSPYTGGYNIMLKGVAEYIRRHPIRDESTNADPACDDDETASEIDPRVEEDIEAFLGDTIPSTAQRCCLPGAKGSEFPAQLSSCIDRQKDLVVTKTQYSLFTDPMIVIQLRARLISDLYICGSLSNIGVYATVLDAVQQGFSVTLIEDCLGFRDEVCHIEAMRQMADAFGASGTDYSELMDDLHGLLGDVIPASQYTRTFELSMHAQNGSQGSSTQKVSQWMETIDDDPDESETPSEAARALEAIPTAQAAATSTAKIAAPQLNDSTVPRFNLTRSPAPSPPRKRSTSDRDESEDIQLSKAVILQETPELNHPPDASVTGRPSVKKSRRESTTSKTSKGSDSSISHCRPSKLNTIGQSQSTEQLETSRQNPHNSQATGRTMSHPSPTPTAEPSRQPAKVKASKQKADLDYRGPGDTIGENDSSIVYDVLSTQDADEAFSALKSNTAWQKMYHRTGEVPRLVAVQGTVAPDGTIPIYRHPADESPPLQPFDSTVDWLRKHCEKIAKHPLNHVLIQYYRNGEDNISEHSDKTLDIVRGSSIVNLSLGAMRTMALRTKKPSQQSGVDESPRSPGTVVDGKPRIAQRVRMPHNSLFILGERTNANWLHSIKADKRPPSEKMQEELAFGGERISLTFRNIGTFIDPKKETIWGQGATCKTQVDAKKILEGKEAEDAGEQMIIGFGKENHLNDSEFSWQDVYGSGFDVVNFEIKVLGA